MRSHHDLGTVARPLYDTINQLLYTILRRTRFKFQNGGRSLLLVVSFKSIYIVVMCVLCLKVFNVLMLVGPTYLDSEVSKILPKRTW